ncbi:FliM/FliN family flagellar motor C-terminal domain-containing protein [Sphingomonas sp. Y38-1Y]|uniref:FliM/FliN family flagellar motor C-terminal domain-containing protein n=1 Tax=Sphingomonas sp. Y38-1Y TaxID=3078265 RepID=UPI0028E8E9AC|nr:FliM/FliN family flagellar motor C-terminal domain-containing protein [Sphingomonas sp. Y38-1Y]
MQDLTERPAAAEPAAPPPPDARFGVSVTIEIDAGALALGQIQGLAAGSVVPVDAATDGGGIPVRLLAAGKPFARGTLVSVGDAYGVLIGD